MLRRCGTTCVAQILVFLRFKVFEMDQNLQNYKQSCDSKHSNSLAPIEIAEKILDFFNKVFYFVEESIKCIGSDFLPPPPRLLKVKHSLS